MKKRNTMKCLILLILIISSTYAARREKSFDYTPSYFLYPIASEIPGLGRAWGGGLTVNNMASTDMDLTAIKLSGDFNVSLITLLNTHLLKERFILDTGLFNYNVATIVYDRGPNSSASTYLVPKVKGKGYFFQLTNSYYDRMFEILLRKTFDKTHLLSLTNQQGTYFETKDNEEFVGGSLDFGLVFDLTDHRYDPYQGLKLEALLKAPLSKEIASSKYVVIDINSSLYIPLSPNTTWAFNYFQSDAIITKKESTDYQTLKEKIGLNCDQIPIDLVSEKEKCQLIENKRINERILFNQYARATPLGGSQRLRSFDNGRFFAGKSRFFGTELRLNFYKKNETFNYLIMKGIRTGFQLAFFAETGTVADKKEEINFNKNSFGIGGRIIFKGGTVFRFDLANGSNRETKSTIFIDYPWSLNPVDNSSR